MGVCRVEGVHGMSGSSTREFSLRRCIELICSLISVSHSVKAFAGKWQTIRSKLNELNAGLIAAENCDLSDNASLSDVVSSIILAVNDCRDLARRCVDLSYSGKLLMQSDLDLIAAGFDCLIKKLSGIYNAGILTSGCAIVVSKPNFGVGREDMRFYLNDLLTRMKIGDSNMKKQALAGLNEVLIEDDMYGTILGGMDESINLLVKFLYSLETEIQEEAAKAASLISRVDSCRGALVGAGIIAPLIRVLECETESAKENSARALQNLTQNSDNAWSVSSYGGVTALLAICTGGGDPGGELVGLACGILKNLSGVEEIKKFMVEEGAISVFIRLAKSKDESLQVNSIDALQILASGDESIRQLVFKQGGVRALIRILDPKSPCSPSPKTTAMSLRAIESLCLLNPPSTSCVNLLLCYGFLDHLLVLLRSGENSVQEQALRVAVKFCRVSEESKKAMGDAGFMPELVSLLASKPSDVRVSAAEAIAGLISVSRNRKRFVQDDRNVSLVLQQLGPEQWNDASPCHRKFLLSAVMELAGCDGGRRKISGGGHVRNIEKLAEAGVSDAKSIVKKLSRNRFRSLLHGLWNLT